MCFSFILTMKTDYPKRSKIENQCWKCVSRHICLLICGINHIVQGLPVHILVSDMEKPNHSEKHIKELQGEKLFQPIVCMLCTGPLHA